MKVLIVTGVYYPHFFGGTERSAQELAEALVKNGHQVVVAALNPRKGHETAEVNGVRVHYLPIRNIYFPGQVARRSPATKLLWHALDTYNPFMAMSLGRVLDAERPDVVNCHNVGGFSVAAWKAVKSRGLPLVNSTHGVNHLCPFFMLRKGSICQSHCLRCRIYSKVRMLQSGHVDVLTGVSRFVVDTYSEHGGFPNAEKMVVYNACPMLPAAASPTHPQNGALRLGFLGRLEANKGVSLLLRSFLELPDGQAELVIAGRGPSEYEREAKEIANGHPGVRWLGFVPPEELLGRVDVLVVPSLLHDTAPRSVLEAMAQGVPVIGARRGGIPELVGDGTGWIFDPDETGSLTRALEKAIDSRSELAAMGERGIQWVQRFSTEAMVDGYLEAYSRAIAKNSKNTPGN